MHPFRTDFRSGQQTSFISRVRHFGLGLGLGLAILILLQILTQPFQRSSQPARGESQRLSAEVAALEHTVQQIGLHDKHRLATSLEQTRLSSQGRIAWIQLRDSSGIVVAQTGRAVPFAQASNSSLVVKSYRLDLEAGQRGRLDVAFRMAPSHPRRQTAVSHLRQI